MRSENTRVASFVYRASKLEINETKKLKQLENVAINDVLPLKAARRDTNLQCFWDPGQRDTSDLISMALFTFTTRRHLIRLTAAPFTTSRLASVVGFSLPYATPGNEAEQRILCGGWAKTSVLF